MFMVSLPDAPFETGEKKMQNPNGSFKTLCDFFYGRQWHWELPILIAIAAHLDRLLWARTPRPLFKYQFNMRGS
jgi:hypothetical protein